MFHLLYEAAKSTICKWTMPPVLLPLSTCSETAELSDTHTSAAVTYLWDYPGGKASFQQSKLLLTHVPSTFEG